MSRNNEVLEDFVAYCKANPDLRFWQALLAWSGLCLISASSLEDMPHWTCGTCGQNSPTRDTFYWKGRNQ
jgi:hypothetical protein